MSQPPITILLAAAARDGAGFDARPAALAIQNGRVIAAGHPSHIIPKPSDAQRVVDLSDCLLLPLLVNAHAHLDLTHIGPLPFDGDFSAWLRQVTARRRTDPAAQAEVVRSAIAQSRAQGVGVIGDIASTPAAVLARMESGLPGLPGVPGLPGLPGVSYLEFFGPLGFSDRGIARLTAMLEDLRSHWLSSSSSAAPRLGLSPHAPYTCSHPAYEHAVALHAQLGFPLCTHLAESPEEDQFVRDAAGFFVEHLKFYQQWSGQHQPTGQHPVAWMSPHLRAAPWLLAHCNYVDDDHIALLADCRASVAYCPIASAYFGHPKFPIDTFRGRGHRYRDMLAAGVNVCLGTDSILCQPPPEVESQPLSIFATMRYLYRRDQTDPNLLLRMATVHGLRALGMDEDLLNFAVGSALGGLIALPIDAQDSSDPLAQALRGNQPVRVIDLAAL
ncbi:MAG: amidohydrolase family protein [Phycisphaeraceae bacterium]|nr:amidohydrolase family protein [Phycisphaeraceae bacterium]